MSKGYDIRFEDYNIIHENTKEDWKAFISTINAKKREKILDLAGGYGDVTKNILAKSSPEIFIIDNSKEQLKRLEKKKIIDLGKVRLADIKKIPFEDSYFDACVIKMGIHEVSKKDQIKIFEEAFRVLKPKGRFVVWELALNRYNQIFFQKFIRKKDKLSGFRKMAKKRYFPRGDENISNFNKAGFVNVQEKYTKNYCPKPSLRKHELVSKENGRLSKEKLSKLSKKRLKRLIEYTRRIISRELRESIAFKDFGEDIQFEVEKKIYVGYKPEAKKGEIKLRGKK